MTPEEARAVIRGYVSRAYHGLMSKGEFDEFEERLDGDLGRAFTPKALAADELATIDCLIHCAIASHGGERIVAGPKMEVLVTEIRGALQEQGWLGQSGSYEE